MHLLATLLVAGGFLMSSSISLSGEASSSVGISKEEATQLATRFVANEIRVEAAVGEPTAKGDNWVFPVKFGYRRVVHPDPILVNRRTGKVSWAGLAAHNAAPERAKGETPK